MLSMFDAQAYLPASSAIGSKFVRDHDARGHGMLLQQLAHQALGGLAIPAALNQDIEDEAVLVHSPPQIMPLPGNRDDDLGICRNFFFPIPQLWPALAGEDDTGCSRAGNSIGR